MKTDAESICLLANTLGSIAVMLTEVRSKGRVYLGMPYPYLPLENSLEAILWGRFLKFCLGNGCFLLRSGKSHETELINLNSYGGNTNEYE